ncbi:MAG: winged helix-turn-helix transcriptional regulator [Flavobacteriales bacterium]|nr:winged helix-turn-helix transcriptional regulator [Flavobacteriales bacterium]
MQGEKVVELVNLFEAFHTETGSDDLKAFSVWLNRRMHEPDLKNDKGSNIVEANRFIVWNIHRLSKYFRFHAKSFLNPNGLNNMDEYFFLVSINNRGTPAKNEVYKDTISELTTGAQMMRRLINIGMVREIVDKKDKRIKRVELTAKGKKTRENIFEQSKKDLLLKSGNLSEQEKMQLKSLLTYLEQFHGEIYQNDSDKPVDEILSKYLF